MMLFERAGGKIIEQTEDRTVLLTPVIEEMLQVDGILHGGMSAYLAETAANLGARYRAADGVAAVGLDLTSTHLLPVEAGDTVRSVATAVRRGGKVQVWRVEQYRESDGALFNVSQLTTYGKRLS